jgi:hypothetical protein
MGCGLWFAIMLIVVGAWIWGSNHGLLTFSFYRDWPLLFIVLGVVVFAKLWRKRRRS